MRGASGIAAPSTARRLRLPIDPFLLPRMATTLPPRPGKGSTVAPALPLALLEAVQSHDRPGEVLEDEDLAVSLPRRLGLTGVILTQIRRYETAYASGRKVPLNEILDLMRLVLRRPDAPTILNETGRRVARLQLERRFSPSRTLRSALPRTLRFAFARRAAHRLLRTIGGGPIEVLGKPFELRMNDSPMVRLDPPACALYTGALREVVELQTGEPHEVIHVRCAARGDPGCDWTLPAE